MDCRLLEPKFAAAIDDTEPVPIPIEDRVEALHFLHHADGAAARAVIHLERASDRIGNEAVFGGAGWPQGDRPERGDHQRAAVEM